MNYHELQLELDAARPSDGSDAPVRVTTIRTCYPHLGIEVALDDMPVFNCNRWEPPNADYVASVAKKRIAHMESAEGIYYQRELAEWQADQARLRSEEQSQANAPVAEMTFFDEVRAAMQGENDRAELRVVGDPRMLHAFAYPALELSENFIQTVIGGDATYQVRVVHQTEHGETIAFIKTIKIPHPNQTKEST